MADDDEQPTQVLSGAPTPPRGGTATLDPHEPRLADGGTGGGEPPYPPTGYGGDGGGDGWDGDDDDGNDRRIAIFGGIIGILVVIILFLVLKPGNDDSTVSTSPSATVEATATVAATPDATDQPEATATAAPEPTATPAANGGSDGGAAIGGNDSNVPTLDSGGVTKFTVSQGDDVVFKVRNDDSATQEVHVHGYDKAYDVEPGETRTISFKASITGIFEIEFEGTGTQIGELTVEP